MIINLIKLKAKNDTKIRKKIKEEIPEFKVYLKKFKKLQESHFNSS